MAAGDVTDCAGEEGLREDEKDQEDVGWGPCGKEHVCGGAGTGLGDKTQSGDA